MRHLDSAEPLSATLLAFGAPIIGDANPEMPEALLRDALTFVITVWNSHSMALPAWGHPEHLIELNRLVSKPGAEPLRDIMDDLARRRDEFYRLDARVVGEWELVVDDQGRRLRCEVRLPFDEPRPSEHTEATMVGGRAALH